MPEYLFEVSRRRNESYAAQHDYKGKNPFYINIKKGETFVVTVKEIIESYDYGYVYGDQFNKGLIPCSLIRSDNYTETPNHNFHDTDEWYRVFKLVDGKIEGKQLGAFKVFDNAQKCAHDNTEKLPSNSNIQYVFITNNKIIYNHEGEKIGIYTQIILPYDLQ